MTPEREAEIRANWIMTILGLFMMAIVVGVLLLNSWMADSFRGTGTRPQISRRK